MIKTYKYRLDPNKNQAQFFEQCFGCCRFIYNWALDKKIKAYQNDKTNLSWVEIAKEMTTLKKQEDKQWLCFVPTQSLQFSLRNMDSAYKNFFRTKKGFPKFKSKHKNHNSFQVIQNFDIDFVKHKVKIPKLGWVNFFDDGRRFTEKIGTITISKIASYYFISILVDDGKSLAQKTNVSDNETTIGVDVGIRTFATLSNGKTFENPKYLERAEKRLSKHQRRLSKKQKGSNRRKKALKNVALQHYKVACKRENFLHEVTNYLLDTYDTIIVEDLNIKGMVKNHNLAKSISSVSWSRFFTMLSYKAEWRGKNVIKIGRFDASSQLCNNCKQKNADVKNLSVRDWQCPFCGATHDRDVNAAINIRSIGLGKYSPAECGGEDVDVLGCRTDEASSSNDKIFAA